MDTAMEVDQAGQEPVAAEAAAQPAAPTAAPPELVPAPEANHVREATPPPAPRNPDLDVYEQHWQTVQQDPSDFTTWTQLLSVAEKMGDLERIRAAYDAFLAEYPLCYGYWKKYADVEVRHQSPEQAAAVYERGVAATPYSADLWGHYAAFKKNQPDATPDDVRGIYERGLAYVSTDYNSHTLWDKYFAFEQEQASTLHVASLFSRVLACPIKELDRYYTSFKNYIHSLTAQQVMLPDDYTTTRAKLDEQKRAEMAAKAPPPEAAPAAVAVDAMQVDVKKEEPAEEAAPGAEPEGPPGEAPAPGVSEPDAAAEAKPEGTEVKAEAGAEAADGAADAAPPAVPEPKVEEEPLVSDEEVKAIWVKSREATYETSKQELLKRKPFEDAVRRPYFHVKPLDGVQLFNWVKYLDATEPRGDLTNTVLLYERCLVACASYPEFWQRYVRFLEKADPQSAKAALDRALLVFCKRHPSMHLFAARYDERHGDVEGARARYKHLLHSVAPRMLEAVTAAANFERRQGNTAAGVELVTELLNEERAREGSKTHPFLAMHCAQYLRQFAGDVAGGRKALDDAIQAQPGIRSLWEAAIHFEEQVGGPEAVARALRLFDTCTSPPAEGASSSKCLAERDREELCARAVDFADMYGDAAALTAAQRRYAERFMLPASVTADATAAASAKRAADGAGAAPAAKAARPDAAATPAAAAAAAAPAAAVPPAVPPAAPAAGHMPPAPPAPMYGYPPAHPHAPAPYPYYPGYSYPGYSYPGYGY